jgi:hypothetical protein
MTSEERDQRIIQELESIRKNVQFFFYVALATIFLTAATVALILG